MKDAQGFDHVNLTNIIERLRQGQYVVPDFQRDFEGEPSDIASRALTKSLQGHDGLQSDRIPDHYIILRNRRIGIWARKIAV